jgi:hypothetical protein
MDDFKGIKAAKSRYYDKLMLGIDGGAVLIGVTAPEFRADAGMSVTPATARKIAARLMELADAIDAA